MATKQGYLSICDPDLTPIAATKSSPFISRRAFDPSGRLGSLYDAYSDRILSNSTIDFLTQFADSRRQPKCYMKTCNIDECVNLLKWCNIQDELRLSVALEMTPTTGMGTLIKYFRPIDKYTRFMSYNYYSWTDYIEDDEFKISKEIKPPRHDTRATHMIVLVNWGIDAVIALQLPPDDEQIEEIDCTLQKLCISLSDDHSIVTLSEQDKRLLEKIRHIEVFSNIPELTRINSIIDFHRDIPSLKYNSDLLKPYNYNLCPIEHFYTTSNGNKVIFTELQKDNTYKVESYLLQLSLDFARLTKTMDQDYPNLRQSLNIELNKMQTSWHELKVMYTIEIHRFQDIIMSVRRGEIDQSKIPDALSNDQSRKLRKMISDFTNDLNAMDKKEHFIKDLLEKRFTYQNAIDRGIENGDDEQALERKLLTDANCTRIICSNDYLYETNRSQWYTLCGKLLKEYEENPQLQLIYVDFSYSSYKLNDIIILPIAEKKNIISVPPPVTTLPIERQKSDESINILLLGESGVGKSTFINALANYLKFDKLKEAEEKPIVLIPVSFIMTTDDNFTEHLVKFEGNDTLSNEDHDNLGQSVTQHCKSYVFTLRDGESRGQKLRIIDTPGIGDTHGSGQDNANLQHILSYITNLTHLNAICILLKSNNVRLDILFRSWFMELFDMLTENTCDRIIFCFTNSRSTFYTPGSTVPVLKVLLNSLPGKKIPFTKANTFCFDSESFRYLVARLNGITFEDVEEQGYNDSWEKSSNESNRLLEYVLTKMSIGIHPNESQSMKNARFKINLMIRPMLEAMRNILRNIILSNAGSLKVSIELNTRIIKGTAAICLKCPRESLKVADVWITSDSLHSFQKKCRTCQCDSSEHYSINYELAYKQCDDLANSSETDMRKVLNDLCQSSAEFANFMLEPFDISQNDPFLVGLKRMIEEENDICANKSSCQLNLSLNEQLKELKNNYENTRKKMTAKKECIELDNIYQKIENVSKNEMIEVQMAAIREWYKFMIKHYEYEVPT
ncbi:unnamed protein product [Rotaria sp. Silwood2]|nr:unnamed protein product [Rotaria sp. Silwood2]CAF4010878.1 unnamed protein product [Rotaria sp. Silwood2]